MSDSQIFTIGRGKENDIVISHHTVSRRHAKLIIDGDNLIINDCGSKNGSLIIRNGSPVAIKSAVVTEDDSIVFGDIVISVKELIAMSGQGQRKPIPRPLAEKKSEVKNKKIRCKCGAVKAAETHCPACGKK